MFHLRGLATYRGGVIVSLALVIFVLTTSVGRCETTACPKEDDGWSDAEKEVYKTFCADRSYGRLGLRLTETRYDVSAKFIVELLTNDAYRKSGSRGFRLSSIRSVEPIDLRHLKTAESIAFVNSELLGGVNLSSAVIDGDLSFLDSKLGPVVLTHAIVKGSVLLGQAPDQDPSPEKNRGGLIVFGVDAEGAQIESDMTIEGVDLFEGIDFEMSHIKGVFSVVRSVVPKIDLTSAIVDNQLIIVDDDVGADQNYSAVDETRNQTRTYQQPDIALGLFLVRAGQSVFLDGSNFRKPILASGAVIQSNLTLAGTHLGSLIADGMDLKGEFIMGYNDKAAVPGYHGESPVTGWNEGSELDLRGATIGGVFAPELPGAWPTTIHLANFHVTSFTPAYCWSNASFPVIANATCPPHDATWFKRWLALDPEDENILQPYQIVIDILNARGDKEEASYVGFARGDKALWAAFSFPFFRFAFLGAYRFMVGYGYYPEWSVRWIRTDHGRRARI